MRQHEIIGSPRTSSSRACEGSHGLANQAEETSVSEVMRVASRWMEARDQSRRHMKTRRKERLERINVK